MNRAQFRGSLIESRFWASCFAVCFPSWHAPDLRAQSYTVTDLGTLGGSLGSAANAIHSSGQVVGSAFWQH
jgi:hypothetical protein